MGVADEVDGAAIFYTARLSQEYLKRALQKVTIMLFVVARYNENVNWTCGIPNCVIYNKGATPPTETYHPVIPLENVGREGHTYLHHIITNYDDLDDWTAFLQGNPFDHTPDLEARLRLFSPTKNGFQYLSRDLYDINLCYDRTDFSLHALLIDTYRRVFGQSKTDHGFRFGAGAQFIVSRDAIRSRPKAFYENILAILATSVNPPEGFAIERFWWMIFMHKE